LRIMGIAGDQMHEAMPQKKLGRLLSVLSEPAQEALRCHLGQGAVPHGLIKGLWPSRELSVPFRMADDRDQSREHHPIDQIGGPPGQALGRKFDENVIRAVDRKLVLPDVRDHLGMDIDLGSRIEIDPARLRLVPERPDTDLEILRLVTGFGHGKNMRGQGDPRDPVLPGYLDHPVGFGLVGRSVIPIRKNVGVEVDQACPQAR